MSPKHRSGFVSPYGHLEEPSVQLSFIDRLRMKGSQLVPISMRRLPLPRGTLSVTFDDFPKSAWRTGGAVLAECGVKATYYASGGFCGRTIDGIEYFDHRDLQEVREAGHRIGCHTFDHLRALRHSPHEYLTSIKRNKEFLSEHLPGEPVCTFAFAFGEETIEHRWRVSRHFAACRSIGHVLNGPLVDPSHLVGVGLERRQRERGDIMMLIEKATEVRGWLILYTHDVGDRPSAYGCTATELDSAIRAAKAAGMDILTVEDVVCNAAALDFRSGRSNTEQETITARNL